MNPQDITKKTYAKIARRWMETRNGERFWEEEVLVELKSLKDKGKVLDVGCGYGRDSGLLVEAGFEYLGTDYSPEMIELAEVRYPDRKFEVADMYDLSDYRDFDVVWAMACLVHIPKKDAPQILKSFKGSIKSDGIIAISLKEGDKEAMEDFEDDSSKQRLMVYWQESDFRKVCDEADLEVINLFRRQHVFSWMTFYLKKRQAK